MNIYQKLIEVRKEVPYLQKENAGAQYKYVSSSQVLSNCKKKMDELGLLLVPCVTGHKVSDSIIEQFDKEGRVFKRTITYFTELDMTMTWVNAEKPDETISCAWYGQGVDIAGEKGTGKAMTYAEKYFMLKFFNIPTDKDDPDAFQEKTGGESPKKGKPQKEQTETPPANGNPARNGATNEAPPTGPVEMIDDNAMKSLHALAAKKNMDHEALSFRAYVEYGVDGMKNLTLQQARALYAKIKDEAPMQQQAAM